MFRSDALHAITAHDLAILHSLDIATIVDLRSSREISSTGRGRLESSSIKFIEVDALSEHSSPIPSRADEVPLHDVYWRYLTTRPERYVFALETLADPGTYPVIVNCFFGKDRTGILVALVLACLDVPRDVIIDDYALSATRMTYIVERLQEDPVYRETLARTPSSRLDASPDTMMNFLDRLEEHFGGARSWALHAGVSSAQLESMRSALLQ